MRFKIAVRQRALQGEENFSMNNLMNYALRLKIWKDTKGQDLIE